MNRPSKHLSVCAKTEELFRAVFNQTYQFIGLLTPDGIILEANKTALKFIGKPAGEVTGLYFWDTPWWSHSSLLQEELKQAVARAASGELARMQVTHPDAEGKLHWIDFSIKPYFSDKGEVIYLIPEGRDVTQLRETEQNLRQSKEMLEKMVAAHNEDLANLRKEVAERKAAQQALIASEKSFMEVFYSSPDAMLLIEDGIFIDCNQATVEMLRAEDKNQVLATHPSDLSPPTQPDGQSSLVKADRMITNAFEKGVHRFEWEHRRIDGEVFPVEVSLISIVLGGKQMAHCVWRDLTRQKEAERALNEYRERLEALLETRESDLEKLRKEVAERKAAQKALTDSENRFMDVFYSSPDAMMLIDGDIFVDINQAALKMLRARAKDEILSKRPADISPPAQPDGQDSRLKADGLIALAHQKGVHRFEWLHTRMDGEQFPAEVSLTALMLGGKHMMYCVLRDLTEKKAAEKELDDHRDHLEELVAERTDELKLANRELRREIAERRQTESALRQSEERYRVLFNNISDFIYTHDLEGRIISINPLAANSLGYEVEELQGKRLSEFMPEHLRHTIETDFMPDMLKHGHKEGILVLLDSSGQNHYLEYRSVLMQSQGSELFISGSGRDVTEKVHAEKDRKAIQEQLLQAQKMEAVGTLASGVAHDFNNVLQGITGYVELLGRSAELNDKEQGFLAEVLRSAERASQMVKHLLTFSSKAPLALSNLDINAEIQHVAGLLKRTIPKMVTITFHPGRDLHPVKGDAAQIEQLILNLGINARDAMPDGGRLVFETSNVYLDESYLKTHVGLKPGNYVLLTVTDSGTGMDKETQKHIFEPFYTTKPQGKGTGLGLATVFGIVKGHNGHLSCYSEPGLGTTFNIYLPITDSGPDKSRIQAEPSLELLRGSETILLVDDEETIRTLGSHFLSQFGYAVITADSGETALRAYSSAPQRIDLVILDLGMPGMGGKKCLQELRKLAPALKVIIASGYLLESTDLQDQVQGFMGKPYHLRDMLQKVRSVLDGA